MLVLVTILHTEQTHSISMMMVTRYLKSKNTKQTMYYSLNPSSNKEIPPVENQWQLHLDDEFMIIPAMKFRTKCDNPSNFIQLFIIRFRC